MGEIHCVLYSSFQSADESAEEDERRPCQGCSSITNMEQSLFLGCIDGNDISRNSSAVLQRNTAAPSQRSKTETLTWGKKLSLLVCKIPGNNTDCKVFLDTQLNSSWPHRHPPQSECTMFTSRSWIMEQYASERQVDPVH